MQNFLLCALVSVSYAARTHPAMTMERVSFLSDAPKGVAAIMATVEKRWIDLAIQANALDCGDTHNAPNCTGNETKTYAFGNFSSSCHTVTKAIIQTSSGDRSRVQSYMSNVCDQDALKGKPEELCLDFSQYLVKEMSEYQHDNLEGSMDVASICTDFFKNGYIARYAEQERQARAQEQAAREAEERRKADEIAEAQARAEVDAKAALARERLEKMQNATAEADAKREEAVQAAVEAQRKAEASETAMDMQKRLKDEADTAAKEAEQAKAKAAAINERLATTNTSATDQSAEPKEEIRNKTAKSFLAVAPFTFS